MSKEWAGYYNQGWGKNLTPEAYSHPAKVSFKLADRIYVHAIERGWISSGSKIVDPFGGICGFGFHALWYGMDFTAVELEPKFVALGRQNIVLWQRKYGSKEGWGTARIIQGDSRQLGRVIGAAEIVISSPPFQSITPTVGDPNYAWKFHGDQAYYGFSPGQLGAMKEGEPPRVDMVLGSPPFSQAQSGGGINKDKIVRQKDGRVHALGNDGYNANMQGDSPGQLGSLPEGRFEAVVDGIISSPPFSEDHSRQAKLKEGWNKRGGDRFLKAQGFAKTEGNIAKEQGDTFWQAAREIVAECHAILKPGGHAIWVTKRFVRGGKIIPFSDQWQALCESVGFRLVCRHQAMLVKNHGHQETIWDGTKQLRTERKSFFRRLAEKKGSPAIDWEDCLCLVKKEV